MTRAPGARGRDDTRFALAEGRVHFQGRKVHIV